MISYDPREVRGDGLTAEEAQSYIDSGQPFAEIFAVDVTGIMQDYDDAIDFLTDWVVFGEIQGYHLEMSHFQVVGVEEDNILDIRIEGVISAD